MPPGSEPLPFGIGCFYFVPVEPAPASGQTARYKEIIQGALDAIPNANSIVIEGGDDPDVWRIRLQGNWPSLDVPSFAAYPSLLSIEFDLFIPVRIQEQIVGRMHLQTVASEQFHIRVVHYDMPLVVVSAMEYGREGDGSDYIVLVREHLKRELDSSDVRLSCLGPSPFHGDFSLDLVGEDRALCVSRIRESRGYSEYRCTYGRADQALDHRQPLREVLHELAPELEVFYAACRQRLLRLKAWEAIEGPRQSLPDGKRSRAWTLFSNRPVSPEPLHQARNNSADQVRDGRDSCAPSPRRVLQSRVQHSR